VKGPKWASPLFGFAAVVEPSISNMGYITTVLSPQERQKARAADWSAVIDARMRKRAVPEGQRGLAPLTIGLGPNFIAGENVDVATNHCRCSPWFVHRHGQHLPRE
jgi:hypothetical protein